MISSLLALALGVGLANPSNLCTTLSATPHNLNIYVNSTSGSDMNACTSADKPCLTLNNALCRVPTQVNHAVTITVDAYTTASSVSFNFQGIGSITLIGPGWTATIPVVPPSTLTVTRVWGVDGGQSAVVTPGGPGSAAATTTSQNMTFYVDANNGNDYFTGTPLSPFATINHALSLVPKNIAHTVLIYLADGTYPENLELAFTFEGNGTLAIEGQDFVTYVPDAGSAYGNVTGSVDGGPFTYTTTPTAPDGGTFSGTWIAHALRGKFLQVLTGGDAPWFLPIADNSTSTLEIPDYADSSLIGSYAIVQPGAVITGTMGNTNPIISVDSTGGSDHISTYTGNPNPAGSWGSNGSLQLNNLTISDDGTHSTTPIRVASGKVDFTNVAFLESAATAVRPGTGPQPITLINTAIGTAANIGYSYVAGQVELGGTGVLTSAVAGALDTLSGSSYSSCPYVYASYSIFDGKILNDTTYAYTDAVGITGSASVYFLKVEIMNGHYGCINISDSSHLAVSKGFIHDCANYYGVYTGHAGQDINTGITMSADTTFLRNAPTDIYVGSGTPDGGMSAAQLRALSNKVFRDPATNAAAISQ